MAPHCSASAVFRDMPQNTIVGIIKIIGFLLKLRWIWCIIIDICKAVDPLESKERAYEKKTYCDNPCRRNAFECMRVVERRRFAGTYRKAE